MIRAILSHTYLPARLNAKSWAIACLQVLAMGVLTALASKIYFYLPWSPVPISFQSFSVLLSGILLGSRKGALSQISLIAMGTAGLPVFASPAPGFSVLLGPTGGYILGFVLAAYVAGGLFERFQPKRFSTQFGLVFLSSLFIFLPGLLWLSLYTGSDLLKALQIGFIPYLPGDLLKCLGLVAFLQALNTLKKAKTP